LTLTAKSGNISDQCCQKLAIVNAKVPNA
jgi:hypothetical protein